ncbi:hypothetical protein ABZ369_39015 [Streptomyces sp. NPDC005918]|uniref:hypothetical protein n=1 Tax=Streptomyces sp. NPDC005918 TaxID=3155454 RepID=UPI00340140AC
MCDDELIPPSADLTEDQWLTADPDLAEGPVGERARQLRAPGRRAVLGGVAPMLQ